MKYNWQKSDWPHFQYDLSKVAKTLVAIIEKTGFIQGKIAHLNEAQKTETIINLLVEEAVNTSEIEGEFVSRPDIRSSIQNKLGIGHGAVAVRDKRALGLAELMIDVRDTFNKPLTNNTLLSWHTMLFSSLAKSHLAIGCWRTHHEPMQIISGHPGKQVTHFIAPPSTAVPKEMRQFIKWFNDTAPGKPNAIDYAPLRAAIAHLYFESIHPFEDGNGRIGRAISEKALSQGFGYPAILSLSKAIEENKNAYYAALHTASKTNEITSWVIYFINTVQAALLDAEAEINFILKKSAFFNIFEKQLNPRQHKVVARMLREGFRGFVGGMSAKKYITITGASKATATRDLQALFTMGAFKKLGEGRNVRYELDL